MIWKETTVSCNYESITSLYYVFKDKELDGRVDKFPPTLVITICHVIQSISLEFLDIISYFQICQLFSSGYSPF